MVISSPSVYPSRSTMLSFQAIVFPSSSTIQGELRNCLTNVVNAGFQNAWLDSASLSVTSGSIVAIVNGFLLAVNVA